MAINKLPFNIEILNINKINTNPAFRPVKTLDTFDGLTKNFHPDGLFSQEIFGKIGTKQRQETFSYIDLKCEIIHPLVFKVLKDLKKLYGEIITGKTWAVFNTKDKDFEKSTAAQGETGYHFFLSHFKDLKFEERPSILREHKIKLINKYKDQALLTKLAVLPAGLRDYEVDESGVAKKDEINTLYSSILSITNIIDENIMKIDPMSLDLTRAKLQLKIVELYEYLSNLLDGKSKMVLAKWATRKLYNGTRNVISPLISNNDEFGSDLSVQFNDTVVGLYQWLKMYLPVTMYHIKKLVSKALIGANEKVYLINKKTLHKELVNIDSVDYDKWMSDEGLEKTITLFGTNELRHNILEIDDRYLFLLYLPNDKFFKVIQDIDEIPDTFKKKFPNGIVRPITFAELMYISVYKIAPKMPCLITRYPITTLGSIYPSFTYLKTTTISECRSEINDTWSGVEVNDEGKKIRAIHFPIKDMNFFETLSPHPAHLKRLNADFDGDTCSANGVYMDNSIKEITDKLKQKEFYISNGKITYANKDDDTSALVLASITQ